MVNSDSSEGEDKKMPARPNWPPPQPRGPAYGGSDHRRHQDHYHLHAHYPNHDQPGNMPETGSYDPNLPPHLHERMLEYRSSNFSYYHPRIGAPQQPPASTTSTGVRAVANSEARPLPPPMVFRAGDGNESRIYHHAASTHQDELPNPPNVPTAARLPTNSRTASDAAPSHEPAALLGSPIALPPSGGAPPGSNSYGEINDDWPLLGPDLGQHQSGIESFDRTEFDFLNPPSFPFHGQPTDFPIQQNRGSNDEDNSKDQRTEPDLRSRSTPRESEVTQPNVNMSLRSSRRTTDRQGTEDSSTGVTPYGPSKEELENAGNSRQRLALQTWYERLNDLIAYKDEHGDMDVPQKYPPNPALGVWVNKQRMEYKNKRKGIRSSMTEVKIRHLENVGFKWAKLKGVAAWNQKFEELQEYKKLHGNCDVPTKHKENRALGRWVSTQRHMYKQLHSGIQPTGVEPGELHRRISLLNSIQFRWAMTPTRREDLQSSRGGDSSTSSDV